MQFPSVVKPGTNKPRSRKPCSIYFAVQYQPPFTASLARLPAPPLRFFAVRFDVTFCAQVGVKSTLWTARYSRKSACRQLRASGCEVQGSQL
jgi:hypothetical protein